MADADEQDELRTRDQVKAAAKKAVEVPLAVKTSDLPKRAASAVVMLLVSGAALWFGGLLWTAFVAIIALVVLGEWIALARRFCPGAIALSVWIAAGALYIAAAAFVLFWLFEAGGPLPLLILLGAVIATDVGAYFTGRALGGPKIAPRISPSKTWAGLLGGMVFSGAWLALVVWFIGSAASAMATAPGAQLQWWQPLVGALVGAVLAVTAQAGDFFESWMKRKAGQKDSGKLIPGHGGFFDRVDGLLAVAFVTGLLYLLFVGPLVLT